MELWNLENERHPIDFDQFKELTEEFKRAVECSFQSDCSVQIRYSDNDNGKRDDLIEIEAVSKASEKPWDEAEHVKVLFYPKGQDPATAKKILHAHIEFKGVAERTASYYMQCGNKDSEVKNQIINNHKQMTIDNGLKSNEFGF